MKGEGRKNLDFLNLNSQLKGEKRLFPFPSEERIKILKDGMEEIQKSKIEEQNHENKFYTKNRKK